MRNGQVGVSASQGWPSPALRRLYRDFGLLGPSCLSGLLRYRLSPSTGQLCGSGFPAFRRAQTAQ